MRIVICGSMKFADEMAKAKKQLEKMGHHALVPPIAKGVNYWAKDNKKKVKAKKSLDLINEHFRKIEKSDAILVINVTKGNIKNYIGANTFLEMGFAYHHKKKIFALNPLPNQQYIMDEILAFEPAILDGDLTRIK